MPLNILKKFTKPRTCNRKEEEPSNFQKLLDFEKEMEIKYDIVGKVDLHIRLNIPSKESITKFEEKMCLVEIGLQNYGNIENLNDRQMNHALNTITHELIHVRNYYALSKKTRDELKNNLGTIADWARKVLDEYSAYKEANELYKELEEELISPQERVLESFTHMCRGVLSGATPEEFYIAFYDYCSALIVHSIVDDEFPINKRNADYVKACKCFMKDLAEAYNRMPLNYVDYNKLGHVLFGDLLIMVPNGKREFFKFNTHMRID